MNRKTARGILIALTLLAVAGAAPVFAQTKGAFSIVCDVTGARVYLNGDLAGYTKPTFSALLSPGQYSVRVSAEGYRDYVTTIQMTAKPLNLNVEFRSVSTPSARHTVVITCNVNGAQVYINNGLAGTAPVRLALQSGSYSLRVSAPGYSDLNDVIVVRGNTSYNALLQGRQFRLSITANVVGAQVYVDNALVGNTPYSGQFAPGTHTVRLSAPGFQEASTTVSLARDESIAFVLQQDRDRDRDLATVHVSINPVFLDPQNRNAEAQIKVYIDGRFENGFSFRLPAGTHNIRISSGGLSVAGDFELAGGRTYTIEPAFGLTVREEGGHGPRPGTGPGSWPWPGTGTGR